MKEPVIHKFIPAPRVATRRNCIFLVARAVGVSVTAVDFWYTDVPVKEFRAGDLAITTCDALLTV